MTVPVFPAERKISKETVGVATVTTATTTLAATRANERFAHMDIPIEIAREVSRYLTRDEIRACVVTCRSWHKSLKVLLWRNLYLQLHKSSLKTTEEQFDGVKVTKARIGKLCLAIVGNELVDELASVEQLWLELPLQVCEPTTSAVAHSANGIARLDYNTQVYWLLRRLNRRRFLSLKKVSFIIEQQAAADNVDVPTVHEIMHRFPSASAHITLSLNSSRNYPIFDLGLSHNSVRYLAIDCDELPTANALFGSEHIPSSVKVLNLTSRRKRFEPEILRDLLVESMIEILTVDGDIAICSHMVWLPRSLRLLTVDESLEGHYNHVSPLILPNLRELTVNMVSGCIFDQILPLRLEGLHVLHKLGGDISQQPMNRLKSFCASYKIDHIHFSGFSLESIACLIGSRSLPQSLTLDYPHYDKAEEGEYSAFSKICSLVKVLVLKNFDRHFLAELLRTSTNPRRPRHASIIVCLTQVYSEPWLTPYHEPTAVRGYRRSRLKLDHENCTYWQAELEHFHRSYQHKTTVERALETLKLNLFPR